MPNIKFLVEHREIEAQTGRSVREVALEAGVYLNREFFRGFNCGGRGLCGTCKVWIHELAQGATSPSNVRERFYGMGDGRRLACQTRILGDLEVSSMPGGDDRLQSGRIIDPPPKRAPDPEPPTKKPEPKKKDDAKKDDAKKDDAKKDGAKKDDAKKDDAKKDDAKKDDAKKDDAKKDDAKKDDA